MRQQTRHSATILLLIAVPAAAVIVCGGPAGSLIALYADEVKLKSGMRLEGRLEPVKGLTDRLIRQYSGPVGASSILMVHSGYKRYYVPNRQVLERDYEAVMASHEVIAVKQRKTSQKRMVASLGMFTAVEPFDKFGRRRMSILTDVGPEDLIVGMVQIGPKYIKLIGLTHVWEFGVATTSVPPAELDPVIKEAIDVKNVDHRMSVARFYLQASLYPQALKELDAIRAEFPEMKDAVEEITVEVRELVANELLAELRRRRASGQHQLALEALAHFPTDKTSPAILRQIRDIQEEYEKARQQIELAGSLLAELEARLDPPQLADAVRPMRSIVTDELNVETLERLDAFFKLIDDDTLPAAQKLAVAYSGWLLGSANAVSNLDEVVHLWNARTLVSEYLRTEEQQKRSDLVLQLKGTEGVSVERLAFMATQLPFPQLDQEIQPAEATKIHIEARPGQAELSYSVLLPYEYNPYHRYPMIVALRPAERSTEDMLLWWGGSREQPGQALRHGYIVIAPEYADEKARRYNYDTATHDVVLRAIRDARKRFNVDSDRIFLSGHGMGGDAAFDIGMSHPDEFAGVIPIVGISRNYCAWYWKNAEYVPFYIVGGQLDRNSLVESAEGGQVGRMFLNGYDVIICDYLGRGYEHYYEEIHSLFDWMALHRRLRNPREFEARVLRPSENRFFWLQGEGFPPNVANAGVTADPQKSRIAPMVFAAKLTTANTIYIRSGAKRHQLWLSPDFVDFQQKLSVQSDGRRKFNDFLSPDIEVLLEDLRVRGDRQMLYWARIDVD